MSRPDQKATQKTADEILFEDQKTREHIVFIGNLYNELAKYAQKKLGFDPKVKPGDLKVNLAELYQHVKNMKTHPALEIKHLTQRAHDVLESRCDTQKMYLFEGELQGIASKSMSENLGRLFAPDLKGLNRMFPLPSLGRELQKNVLDRKGNWHPLKTKSQSEQKENHAYQKQFLSALYNVTKNYIEHQTGQKFNTRDHHNINANDFNILKQAVDDHSKKLSNSGRGTHLMFLTESGEYFSKQFSRIDQGPIDESELIDLRNDLFNFTQAVEELTTSNANQTITAITNSNDYSMIGMKGPMGGSTLAKALRNEVLSNVDPNKLKTLSNLDSAPKPQPEPDLPTDGPTHNPQR